MLHTIHHKAYLAHLKPHTTNHALHTIYFTLHTASYTIQNKSCILYTAPHVFLNLSKQRLLHSIKYKLYIEDGTLHTTDLNYMLNTLKHGSDAWCQSSSEPKLKYNAWLLGPYEFKGPFLKLPL